MLRSASEYRLQQKRRTLATIVKVRQQWALMGEDLDAGWARIAPRVVQLVTAAQIGSARDGSAYVRDALAEQGPSVRAEAAVLSTRLAGVAPDGRSLAGLLYGSVVNARSAKADSLTARLQVGREHLDLLTRTTLADAGRDAQRLEMAVRPRVKFVRVVEPPCCQRCAVLSGRVYGLSSGFQRHPGCDCFMLPQTVADPSLAGRTISPADVTDLTRKQRDLIDSGAGMNRVVNDYQRKRGAFSDFLPPTRVEKVIDRAGQRKKALDALADLGLVA